MNMTCCHIVKQHCQTARKAVFPGFPVDFASRKGLETATRYESDGSVHVLRHHSAGGGMVLEHSAPRSGLGRADHTTGNAPRVLGERFNRRQPPELASSR